MRELRRFAAILSLLENVKVEVGKTFIQKGIYILQDGLDEDLGYNFKIHFYGPFSQELANDVDALDDMGLIDIEYSAGGYGYKISISEAGRSFLRYLKGDPMNINIDDKKMSKILSLLEGEVTRKMELFGTTLYFAKVAENEAEVERLVNMVKPHFTQSEIKKALTKLKREGLIQN